ncbi:alpha/beta hydrolase [Saccharopolyspora sp. TS4A08]|uniref:Alpha/beta hydrolase n=1 Tax=Saccharopolyspora ipomoeae TaxID=3042027 RepID=A0ABT6PN17_9PSEU|nr:alpha/beta hydrolase [Saccharopolyspora sp. TS4A08]MDI2029235.1 alpha/beta hydrolase [Saccharopolyspora sp. TS4A08]
MQRTRNVLQRPELSPDGLVAWHVGGSRPPLVCVHGAGVSSRELLPFVAGRSGIRETWAVDLPGFGSSSGPRRPLDLDGLAQAVEAWRDAAGLGEVSLLGCSFGCQVAVEAALRAPEKVRGLVLVGPTTDPRARSAVGQLRRWLRNSRHEPRGLAPLTFRDYREAGFRRVMSSFAESIRDRVEDKLPAIDVPVLVVRGEHDALVPHGWARRVASSLPRGRLVTWPGAAHMVPYSAPREFGDLVEGFLTG